MSTAAVYVLILMFWDSSHGGNSLAMHDFNSQAACEQARTASAKTMDSGWAGYTKTYSVCVPKGDVPPTPFGSAR